MRDLIREQVDEEFEMDMTPMIDVVFLLIIFFLCIDFKVLEAKLPAYLPKDVGAHSTDVEPQEKLEIKIICTNWGTESPRYKKRPEGSYRLEGHQIHWEVGPKKLREIDKLLEELKRIAKDKSKMQTDPKTGEPKLMGVVVEPTEETTYGDVALTVDAVTNAGFTDVNFGGGMGARGSAEADKRRSMRSGR